MVSYHRTRVDIVRRGVIFKDFNNIAISKMDAFYITRSCEVTACDFIDTFTFKRVIIKQILFMERKWKLTCFVCKYVARLLKYFTNFP